VKIYVASSWRNHYQPGVVSALRHEGFDVYDFKNPAPGNNEFSWRAIDPDWESHKEDVAAYLRLLDHPIAEAGFKLDMDALKACDLCVMVMPCGMSASLETGYAVGAGKPTAVFVPGPREPDLMAKMADLVTDDIDHVLSWARLQRRALTTVP
jgi:hypothetical protein